MIRSFRDAETEKVFNEEFSRKFQAIARVALRKLIQLNRAVELRDLALPGNQLEVLKDDRKGQHSIRINDQYRLCFRWTNPDAFEVEITDYH
jgi:proteic killer suppression protein